MVKSDAHMERIRQRLLDEGATIKRSEDKRKEREGKKFGKQIQMEKLKERERSKKDLEERLKGLKRSKPVKLFSRRSILIYLQNEKVLWITPRKMMGLLMSQLKMPSQIDPQNEHEVHFLVNEVFHDKHETANLVLAVHMVGDRSKIPQLLPTTLNPEAAGISGEGGEAHEEVQEGVQERVQEVVQEVVRNDQAKTGEWQRVVDHSAMYLSYTLHLLFPPDILQTHLNGSCCT